MDQKFVGSCFVGHLPPTVSEADLYLLFSQVHPVHSVRVVVDPLTKASRGYGYVNFAFERGHYPVGEAIRRLNYAELHGQHISVMVADRDHERRRRFEANVFVKGLDAEIDAQTLNDTFDIFGPVLSAKVARSSEGRSLGYGYVQFQHVASAEEAIQKANNMMLKQRTITVEKFKPRHERRSDQFTNLFVKHLPANGKAKGFGFVNFEKPTSARKALNEMHDSEVDGVKLYVQRAQTKAERRGFLERKYREDKRARAREMRGRNLYVKNFPAETTDEELHRLFSRFGTITSAKVMYANGRSRGFGFVCFATVKEAAFALSAMNGAMVGKRRLYVNIAQSSEERKQLLRTLKSGLPLHTLYPSQPYYFPPTMPTPPMLSTMSPRAEYSQLLSFASMPFPMPLMVPPTMLTPRGYSDEVEKRAVDKSHRKRPVDVQNDPELLEMGYAIYAMVYKKQCNQALAQKITGMLLDLGKEQVSTMIKDETLIDTRIDESVTVLQKAGYFGDKCTSYTPKMDEIVSP